MRARREAGQSPVLPSRIEQIRRRADRQAQQDVALPAPGMAAGRIHADREVADQADPHAGLRAPTRWAAATERSEIHCRN